MSFYAYIEDGHGVRMYLSGYSVTQGMPTYRLGKDGALIWIDEAKLQRWVAKHPHYGYQDWYAWRNELKFEEYVPGRDRGGERFRRLNHGRRR